MHPLNIPNQIYSAGPTANQIYSPPRPFIVIPESSPERLFRLTNSAYVHNRPIFSQIRTDTRPSGTHLKLAGPTKNWKCYLVNPNSPKRSNQVRVTERAEPNLVMNERYARPVSNILQQLPGIKTSLIFRRRRLWPRRGQIVQPETDILLLLQRKCFCSFTVFHFLRIRACTLLKFLSNVPLNVGQHDCFINSEDKQNYLLSIADFLVY